MLLDLQREDRSWRRPRWRVAVLLVLGTVLVAGCDDKPSREPPEEPPLPPKPRRPPGDAGLAALLGLDAADLPAPEPPADPPAPPGDLKSEVEAFTTVEACVAARAAFDPVVGDAVEALGYDRLKRDACRVLHAVKQKDASICDEILATSLRQHCVSTVAVTVGDPTSCPMVGDNHDALCTALARRDDRLCSTVTRDERQVCRAVLARDPSVCRHDARCERRVERWRSLLPDKVERPPLGTRAGVSVAERIEGGTLPPEKLDLGDALHGATVRGDPTGKIILLGDPSVKTWPPASMVRKPRVMIRLQATDAVLRQGRHPIPPESVDFALLVPGRRLLTTETLEGPMTLDVDLLDTQLGSPVRFVLEADVGPSHRKFHVRFEVNTFVRDVVQVGAAGAGTP